MAKGIEVAQAYVTIIPEMSGIQNKIANALDADTVGQEAGSKLGSGLASGISAVSGKVATAVAAATAAAAAAALAGVTALTKAAMEGFATYEQLAGGAQQIFNEMDFSRISADAQDAYRTMGLSANDYLEQINQVGAAFSATMGDERGYETAKRGMQAISDYASGTGRNLNELNQKYQMITRSTSSYQSIADQFAGILPATSADFLEQAQAAGLLSGEYTKLTEVPVAEYQQAVTAMLEKGVDSLGLTGNTAREATETITGSIGMLKASWSNFVTELGKDDADLEARTDELVDSVIAVAENVIPRVGLIVARIGTQLPGMIAGLAPKVGAAVSSLLDQVTGGTFGRVMEKLGPTFSKLSAAVSGVTASFEPLMPVIQHIGETIGTILLTAVDYLIIALDNVAPIISALGDALGAVGEVALPVLSTALDVVSGALSGITPVVETLAQFLSTSVTTAIESVTTALQFLSDLLQPVLDTVSQIAQVIGEKLSWLLDMFGLTTSEASSDVDGMDSSVSTSVDNMAGKVDTAMRRAYSSTSSQMGAAASTAETESTRIEDAWDKDYTMKLDAEAETYSAESTLSSLFNGWNGTVISFFANLIGASGFGSSGGAFASGAIIKHADGFIVDKPGRGVDITRHIAGEAGGEAIIPLTNKQYVAPFAKTVADFINPTGVTVTGNTFYVRQESDIRAVAIEINRMAQRERGSKL